MEIPQVIKNLIMVDESYVEWLEKEAAVYAYLDLTNMFHWQDALGWSFSIEDLVKELFTYSSIKEVKIYFGSNPRKEGQSKALEARIKKTGAILRTKPMKFIPKTIEAGMFFQRTTLSNLDQRVKDKIQDLINELTKSGLTIEEPKCNFDVEMALDMLDDTDKMSAILFFSGDCDLVQPLTRLKIKGKKIGIVGVRGKVAGELHKIEDRYFDFGKFYTGKKRYKSENPASEGGTA